MILRHILPAAAQADTEADMEKNTYLHVPLPQARTAAKFTRRVFCGLDRKNTVDSGGLSYCKNISAAHLPCLVSRPAFETVIAGRYSNPISIHGFGDRLFIVYRSGDSVLADITDGTGVYTGTIKASGATDADMAPRSAVRFNRYSDPEDPLSGTYSRKILVFPDRLVCDFDVSSDFIFTPLTAVMPEITHAAVHLSRLFGTDGERIYASGFNDYENWELDTATETLASNAWATTTQSNTKAYGGFTAVCSYDGHAVCFRDGFMQQVYNTKNPFRLVDIGSWGCLGDSAVCEFSGKLAFVSAEGVYLYGGGVPYLISEALGNADYTGAMLAAHGDELYIYLPSEQTVFTYNAGNGGFGSVLCGSIGAMSSTDGGVYAISGGDLIKLDSGAYGEYAFETDILSFASAGQKRLKSISALACVSAGGSLDFYIVKGSTKTLLSASGGKSGIFSTRSLIKGQNAGTYKIRAEGTGNMKIFNLTLTYESGGDTYGS